MEEAAAYNIADVSEDRMADLIFFNKQLNGYYQVNLGAGENGIPLFGDVEARLGDQQ